MRAVNREREEEEERRVGKWSEVKPYSLKTSGQLTVRGTGNAKLKRRN